MKVVREGDVVLIRHWFKWYWIRTDYDPYSKRKPLPLWPKPKKASRV